MCYSGQVVAQWRELQRKTGAKIAIRDFIDLFVFRSQDPRVKLPKALEAGFLQGEPSSDAEREVRALIEAWTARQVTETEQELFKQRKRLADAQRVLQGGRPTKAAADSARIAGNKVAWCLGRLADLGRSEPRDKDSRIFPGWYVPVIVMEGGERVIRPMRYQCRPAGRPASHDTRFPGTYNARRDNLEGFWKGQFGRSHALMLATRFYENVQREGKNVVLEFTPRTGQDMWVACLWSRWSAPGERDLLSFAAITDEPPPEVAAAGHDRCIVPIRPEHADAWLAPDPKNLAAQYAILDERERPYYEHRLAA